MKSELNDLPPTKWSRVPLPIQLLIAGLIFITVTWPRWSRAILAFARRVDLILLPPLAGGAAFFAASRFIPHFPWISLATAFTVLSWTVFFLRPPTRRSVHWVKRNVKKSE